MKRCPQCNRVEPDDALVFCRADGTPLVSDLPEAEVTRVLPGSRATGEAPTDVLRGTGEGKLTTSALKPGPASAAIGAPRKSISRRRLALVVGLIALLVAVPIVILVAGYISYHHARNTEVAIDSIAVLPFENQNKDPNTEYLSDGVTESIMNNLTQLPNLRVSPRSTVFRYKGKETEALAIGKELGVRAVLTGRLLQRGDSLTISTELLDVRDNKQVWGERYERKLADALALQQEISREITDRLRLKLSGEEQKQLTKRDTANPEAYQFYLKGRYYWNKRTTENLKKAIEQFQQAADRDPNYALAYVGLADCYSLLEIYAGTPASDTYLKAKAFAQRALQLDGSLAEAHTSLAFADTSLWQWEEAEAEFKRAIKLDPNYPTAHQWYSTFLRDMGRLDESLAESKRAQQLDPLSLIIGQNLAMAYLSLGDVSSSIEQSKRGIDLDLAFPRGHWALGLAYLKQGRHSEAIAELQKAVDLSGGEREMLSHLGYGYAISGKGSAALAILKEVQGEYQKHEALGQDVAAIYAGLGDKDQAFAWLEKDFETRSGQLARVRWEPPFESLRGDPRFADLLRRVGLPQ
jgi:TolB-like protein/Flp pilus assembly protein TadD